MGSVVSTTTFPEYGTIRVEGPDDDGVVQLFLDRPEERNAFNIPMHRELSDALRLMRNPPDVGAVVISGTGSCFSAGGDVSLIKSFSSGPGAEMEVMEEAAALVVAYLSVAPPVITAIHGYAVGLAATFALLADIVMMADDAVIADTHIKAGLVAGDGGTLLWPLLMGPNNAKQYLLTGDPLDAQNAYRLGVANRVLPADDLMDEALRLARRLARGPRTAVAWTKRAVNARILAEAVTHMPMSLAQEARTMHLPDMVEGTTAFLEKRAPKWPSSHPNG
jgi:enoyl-CoA hydratase